MHKVRSWFMVMSLLVVSNSLFCTLIKDDSRLLDTYCAEFKELDKQDFSDFNICMRKALLQKIAVLSPDRAQCLFVESCENRKQLKNGIIKLLVVNDDYQGDEYPFIGGVKEYNSYQELDTSAKDRTATHSNDIISIMDYLFGCMR